MVIPYRTAKLKFADIFAMAIIILGPSTTKFNSCQYFQLYGTRTFIQDLMIRHFQLNFYFIFRAIVDL